MYMVDAGCWKLAKQQSDLNGTSRRAASYRG